MAITLLINPGSSSKKFAFVQDERVVLVLRFERNGEGVELCTEQNSEQQKCEGIESELYGSASAHALDIAKARGVISSLTDITRVGVRVVAPGTFFQKHQIIDHTFIANLVAKTDSAPLHIPVTLHEIQQIQTLLPKALVLAISDSAFHSTMPISARTYSITREDTKNHDIYRFGYHGLSCASVLRRSEELPEKYQKVIIAHIGSGVSLTAVKDGKSIDTSMGFSPASGMVMGTRAGDVEADGLLELMRVKKMNSSEALQYLQNDTGLKGLANESDLRHLLDRQARGDFEAIEALSLFAYRFRKILGGLVGALGGLDAVILTATAVERNPVIRSMLLPADIGFGIHLDEKKNEKLINHDGIISTDESKVTVALIRTQEFEEMLHIIRDFK